MQAVNPESTSSTEPSIDELLQDALHLVRKHLELEVAFISEFKDGRRFFRHVDAETSFCPLGVGNSDPLEESFCQRVVDGRLPELMADATQNSEALTLSVTMEVPIGAHVSVPIKVEDELFGTFCCFSREPKPALDHRDMNIVRLYADFVGRVLKKPVQAERAALERHEQIRHILHDQLFYMVYQPIFHVGTGNLVGHETLTRFTAEPSQSPDRWFHAAEKIGLQVEPRAAGVR